MTQLQRENDSTSGAVKKQPKKGKTELEEASLNLPLSTLRKLQLLKPETTNGISLNSKSLSKCK